MLKSARRLFTPLRGEEIEGARRLSTRRYGDARGGEFMQPWCRAKNAVRRRYASFFVPIIFALIEVWLIYRRE